MIRPAIILATAVVLAATSLSGAAQTTTRPDVLFISIDDLNDWVGPLGGHPQAKTPNMDRLAEQGMVFTNAYAPAMLCNPSRAAIMTGIPPSSSGVYDNQTDWRITARLKDIPTLPRYFMENGYRSFGSGKLFHSSTFNPWAYFGYNDTTAWDDYFPSLERQLPDEVTPHDRPANGSPLSVNFDWSAVATTDMAMGDGQIVSWSAKHILAAGDEPRFNAVGIYRPHLPWYVPQKYLDMHPLEDIVLPTVLENASTTSRHCLWRAAGGVASPRWEFMTGLSRTRRVAAGEKVSEVIWRVLASPMPCSVICSTHSSKAAVPITRSSCSGPTTAGTSVRKHVGVRRRSGVRRREYR